MFLSAWVYIIGNFRHDASSSRAGILVDIDKPSEIASALSSLLEDKEKWDN